MLSLTLFSSSNWRITGSLTAKESWVITVRDRAPSSAGVVSPGVASPSGAAPAVVGVGELTASPQAASRMTPKIKITEQKSLSVMISSPDCNTVTIQMISRTTGAYECISAALPQEKFVLLYR